MSGFVTVFALRVCHDVLVELVRVINRACVDLAEDGDRGLLDPQQMLGS